MTFMKRSMYIVRTQKNSELENLYNKRIDQDIQEIIRNRNQGQLVAQEVEEELEMTDK